MRRAARWLGSLIPTRVLKVPGQEAVGIGQIGIQVLLRPVAADGGEGLGVAVPGKACLLVADDAPEVRGYA
jgi:hypothetical protein